MDRSAAPNSEASVHKLWLQLRCEGSLEQSRLQARRLEPSAGVEAAARDKHTHAQLREEKKQVLVRNGSPVGRSAVRWLLGDGFELSCWAGLPWWMV